MNSSESLCFVFFTLLAGKIVLSQTQNAVWKWECLNEKCTKTRIREEENQTHVFLGLDMCRMFCEKYGLLWPRPTGQVELGSILLPINIRTIQIAIENHGHTFHLMEAAAERFKEIVFLVVPEGWIAPDVGKQLNVNLVNLNPNKRGFALHMNESYALNVSLAKDGDINATVTADCFFGVRHGLETLSQLIIFDSIREVVVIAGDVTIDDEPKFPYRGIMLDTARSYFTIDAIKRTIDAMAAVKMNTFHWHITDTHSFPFVSERRPILSKLGAYSPHKVYTLQVIREVVQYGYERGVRILPEFDGPGHVGEGWQESNLTVCFNAEPWYDYCSEPPCGQLNPVRREVYEYLADIYADMAESFQSDMFHMGGNEVSENCWQSSEEIKDFMSNNYLYQPRYYSILIADHKKRREMAFKKMWSMYQNRAQEKLYQAYKKKLPIVLWSSPLTDPETIETYLNKEEYIIQVWTKTDDEVIKSLLNKGYRIILSNQDILFFNCGLSSWIGTGLNWCSPYKGWKEVYNMNPTRIAKVNLNLVLGAEACLWSEQTDAANVDARLWPRAAALAERLWSDPTDISWVEAEGRLTQMRERLYRSGIFANPVQPEFCYQNDGACYGRASTFRKFIFLFANFLILLSFIVVVFFF